MKIGLVGCGMVGSSSAYALVMSGVGHEIVLVDLKRERGEAEANDISHAVPFAHPLVVRVGDYDLRLYDIKALAGKLTFWLDIADTRGGEVHNVFNPNGRNLQIQGSTSWAIGLIHRRNNPTAAPQLSRGGKFFSRPQIRLFVTYAKWSDDFKGLVSGPAYANDLEGLSYGVQAETWW